MGYFEVYLYDICGVKWGSEFKKFLIENWSRFLDDCKTALDTITTIISDTFIT